MNDIDQRKTSNGGFSEKEFDLIQQLVKTKMEQESQLEYESFEGYEVPPRTQFSMLNKPAISIKFGQFSFNMACIRLFEGVEYILPLINPKKKSFMVAMCKEEESSSIVWARKKNGKWINKNITAPDFVEDFFKIMKWDRKARYKILGQVVMTERGPALRFDLEEAIMFAAKPDEYVDPKTGATKKRQIKYYPDQYKDRYGKTYSDYMATHPVGEYESFDDYISMSSMKPFSDVMKSSLSVDTKQMTMMEEGKNSERRTDQESSTRTDDLISGKG